MIAAPAAAVTIVPANCVSVTAAAGCLFNGNLGNAGDALAAQNQYNALREPDISLSLLGKSDDGFGTLGFGDSTNSFGSWSTPGYLVSFIGVKASNDFILYQLAVPASSGTWSTAGLVNKQGIQHALSHLAYFGGAVGAVPEPSTWAMMICGFGMAGSVLRRQKRQQIAIA